MLTCAHSMQTHACADTGMCPSPHLTSACVAKPGRTSLSPCSVCCSRSLPPECCFSSSWSRQVSGICGQVPSETTSVCWCECKGFAGSCRNTSLKQVSHLCLLVSHSRQKIARPESSKNEGSTDSELRAENRRHTWP